MRYLIDSAAPAEIEQALAWGACGITANPSMYLAQNVNLETFLQTYAKQEGIFLSGEVLADTAEEMVMQAERIGKIDRNIVIKINCSEQGLEACKLLTQRGFRCAMTLIFTVAQAVAAMNAGAAYVFPFVGRTDQYSGGDGLQMVADVTEIAQRRNVYVAAASIKSLYQLEMLAKMGVDYAAIPFALYQQSLYHPLTSQGAEGFAKDWNAMQGANTL